MPVQPLSRATHRRQLAPLAAGGPQHRFLLESACHSRVRRNAGSSRNCSSRQDLHQTFEEWNRETGAGSCPSGLDSDVEAVQQQVDSNAARREEEVTRDDVLVDLSVAARPPGQRDVVELFRRAEPADIVDNRRQQRTATAVAGSAAAPRPPATGMHAPA